MRVLLRLVVTLAIVALAAGPALAAPLVLRSSQSVSSPAESDHPFASVAKLAAYGLAVFGAIRIKDTGTLAQKFVTRASAAATDYRDGVATAGGDWETNTKNSESSYEAGVQEAIGQKRFGKGVSAAGGSKYQENAVKLGGVRYAPGVQNAQGAWQKGVGPYLEKLKGLSLPPKGPRRSPQNQQRANMVALELGKLRTGQ